MDKCQFCGTPVPSPHVSDAPNTPQPEPAPNQKRPTWELVIEDMQQRDQIGRTTAAPQPEAAPNADTARLDLLGECQSATRYSESQCAGYSWSVVGRGTYGEGKTIRDAIDMLGRKVNEKPKE